MRYAVVVEKAENNCSACVPDLPGCVAAAETKEELLDLRPDPGGYRLPPRRHERSRRGDPGSDGHRVCRGLDEARATNDSRGRLSPKMMLVSRGDPNSYSMPKMFANAAGAWGP